MSIRKFIEGLTDEELVEIFDNFESASDYLRSISVSSKGQYSAPINKRGKELNLEWNKHSSEEERVCPICFTRFKVGGMTGKKKEQITCSYSCSNKYFRAGSGNGNFKGSNYRTICFEYHEKKCIVCGEENIVSVHHIDEDHTNNSPDNLVVLCPTHHNYMHSKHREKIQHIIEEYSRFRRL